MVTFYARSRDAPPETDRTSRKTGERIRMMENTKAICGLCHQISASAERIAGLTLGMEGTETNGVSGLSEAYEDARLSELETAQQMILLLTALLAPQAGQEENADEGIFAEGELTHVKGGADKSADGPTDAGEDKGKDGGRK